MDPQYELVMYTRTSGCPFVGMAKRVLRDYGLPYREIFIDLDDAADARLQSWTGFRSVPTLVIVPSGQDVPDAPVRPLPVGESPRGIDRGPMITEPNMDQFRAWLARHGFISLTT